VAYKIAFAFQFLPMSFAAAIYPAMSENYLHDRNRLAHLFTVSTNYLLLVAVPLAIGIAVLAHEFILLLYGEQFLPSVLPLQILMASLIFAFIYWPAGSLLNACDRQAKNTLAMGWTMVVNIILNIILIPQFSIVGAAIAALVGNVTLWCAAVIFSRQVIKVDRRASLIFAGKTIFSAAMRAAVLLALRGQVHVALLVPLGVLTYAGSQLAVGGVTTAEIRLFIRTFLKRGKVANDLVP
jgi:O-antigen/teichoic acid export membrane protein